MTRDELPPGPEIVFLGLESVVETRLLAVAESELRNFSTQGFRLADLDDAAEKMRFELEDRGLAHSSVGFEALPAGGPFERIVFRIVEGPRARISRLDFSGAESLPHSELRALFGRERDGELLFRQSQLERGLRKVQERYQRAGYFRAEAAVDFLHWNNKRTSATIRIKVIEGLRYRIERVEFEGELSGEQEAAIRERLRGDWYRPSLLAVAVAGLRSEFLEDGHVAAKIRPELTFDDKTGAVTCRLLVDAGPVYKLRNIEVEGNERTKPRFIRTRLRLEGGDVIRLERVDRGLDRLYETNLFKKVDVRTVDEEEGEDGEATANLRIEIEEYLARSVFGKIGWGSYERLRGAVGYEDHNFRGIGQVLKLEGRASFKEYGADLSVMDRYLLGARTAITARVGFAEREEPTFKRSVRRASLDIQFDPTKEWALLGTYAYDSQKARDIIGEIPGFEARDFVTSAGFGLRLVHNNFDDKLLPTKGWLGEAGVFWSAEELGADLNYIEFNLRGTWNTPVRERWVLSIGGLFSTRNPTDGTLTLPVQKRYFSGGENSVRS
ncbi:MAG: POTRA domain-containing protein, partial [Planctomycetota bacterium]